MSVVEFVVAAAVEAEIVGEETVAAAVGEFDTVKPKVCALCCRSQLLRSDFSSYVHSHKEYCKRPEEGRL